MSDYLGTIYRTGDPAPDDGAYQLVGDDHHADARTDRSRVIRLAQGTAMPPHPETNGPAEWRFIRVWQEGAYNKPYQE